MTSSKQRHSGDTVTMAKLSTTYKDQLSSWLGGKKDFTLLYQATRDGCSAQAFHQKCDHKGATVSVCYNTAGYVFGGYTSVSWSSDGYWTSDQHAFLFKLQAANSFQPQQYPVKTANVQNTVYHNASYGPTFGGGHDLCPFTSTVYKLSNYFQGNASINPNHTYNMPGESAATFTGNNLQFTDVEVYQVTECVEPLKETTFGMLHDVKAKVLKSEPEMKSPPGNHVDILLPWRKLPEVKQKVLKSELETYAPPGKLNHVNILLLGTVGAGKTSYFNTINSIFKGRITSVARSGSAEHSLTTTYRLYRVKSAETGQPLKVWLCDTRGLEDVRNLDLTDLMVIIDGHLPDRFTFNPSVPVRPGVPGYKKNPTLDDRIHCIAFVVDSTAIDVFPDKVLQTFKAVQHRVNVQGLPQVVLLTKVDKACEVVNKDMSQLFLSAAIRGLVEKTAELFGLPRSHVYPVKNYEDELVLDDNVTLPALTSLVQMTRFADDFLNDCQDLDDD
ncbi:interferon-induced protein 44-like isoform X2 [Haliotis rufescens]|uniref:interferon-induced protein 44-like isoform X2 n=1 Tax=Haliotis rufescens TaxID=6454 RepID=UPI00201F4893|nr:interferon-induced protein 44-like isoform X2 [Haliotis rufescens]